MAEDEFSDKVIGHEQWWATFLLLRAEKELLFLSRATPTTQAKVYIIAYNIHINFFPLGVWRAQELLAGHMQPMPAVDCPPFVMREAPDLKIKVVREWGLSTVQIKG